MKMKRKVFYIISLLSIFFLTSCEKAKNNDMFTNAEDDYYIFELNELAYSYDVDQEGNLYYVTVNKDREEIVIAEDNKNLPLDRPSTPLKVLDSKGELQASYQIPGVANNICYSDNKIYYSDWDYQDNKIIYEFSLDRQTSKKICDLPDEIEIQHMEVIDEKLYFICTNHLLYDKEYKRTSDDDHFVYKGEMLGDIEISTGLINLMSLEFPISFCKTLDDNIMIYAHDDEGGYYFIEYDIKEEKLKEKIYNDMGQLITFRIYNDDHDYIYIKHKSYSFALAVGSIKEGAKATEILPNFKYSGSLICKNGYIYCGTSDGENIIRIRLDSYIRGNQEINMLSPKYYDDSTPFGCGYSINYKYANDYEMALSILSNDKDNDIFLVNSSHEFSKNIRDKGSFYPLNDVKGVSEYINACFPYIKDIATDEDGNIWMIPISVNIPCLLYNEKLCNEYEIKISNRTSFDDFMKILKKLNQNSSMEDLYYYNGRYLAKDFLYQYIRTYKNFDSELFRNLATNIKSEINYMYNGTYGNSMLIANLYNNKSDNFLFTYSNDCEFQYRAYDINNIRACKLPSITDNHSNTATCYFICVNPASKNLETTLQYISSLCNYLLTLDNTMMFSDREIYKDSSLIDDLYMIYSNGDIQFTYPNDVYINDLEKYLMGQLSLEDLIDESNRRLDIYLNE